MRKLVLIAVVVAFLALMPAYAHGACLDTGYRPDRDGFCFANFGDPEGPAGVDLPALLGVSFHDEIVCHTGHCFGMALASIDNFARGNASVDVPQAEAMPGIDRIQTGQSFYYIADFFLRPFGKPSNNTEEYEALRRCLAAGTPAVLGIYSSTGDGPGHAVVAYRIEEAGEKAYIYVYDPNIPATEHDYWIAPMVAVYDMTEGTFSYDNGRAFDEMIVDVIDDSGVVIGKTISLGLVGFPMVLGMLIIRRRKLF
jgi:hypothetical protein